MLRYWKSEKQRMQLKDVPQAPGSSWRLASVFKRSEFWLGAAATFGVGLLFWLISEQLIILIEQAASARSLINTFGPLAPLAYVALFAAQILIAPFPGQFMGVMSGYLFGMFWGSLYSIAGLALGAGLAMAIARRYGKPLVDRYFDAGQVRHWERKLRMRSPVTWGLLFVFPVPDLVFYVAGLSRVPFGQLLLAVIAGRSLGLIFANIFGNLSASLPPEWVLVKWAIVLVAAFFAYRYQRPIRFWVLIGVRRLQQHLRRWRRRLQVDE
jgi:uncharacterized membrane protein YdjX (TVP38/TMEM64 family)